MSKPCLILDAGGVLVTEPVPQWLSWLAGPKTPEVSELYYGQLYDRLWAGDLPTGEFFDRIVEGTGRTSEQAREKLVELFVTTPQIVKVAEWGQRAHLALLSNHRAEWIRPVLDRAGVLDLFEVVWVSAEMGLAKPNPAIYSPVLDWTDGRPALFVDDAPRNVLSSEKAGLRCLLADFPSWEKHVDLWLDVHTA